MEQKDKKRGVAGTVGRGLFFVTVKPFWVFFKGWMRACWFLTGIPVIIQLGKYIFGKTLAEKKTSGVKSFQQAMRRYELNDADVVHIQKTIHRQKKVCLFFFYFSSVTWAWAIYTMNKILIVSACVAILATAAGAFLYSFRVWQIQIRQFDGIPEFLEDDGLEKTFSF